MAMTKSVLACTDDNNLSSLISAICRECSMVARFVKNGREIPDLINSLRSPLIILDSSLQEPCIIDILDLLSTIKCELPIIVLGDCEEKVLLSIKRIGEFKNLSVFVTEKAPFQAHSFLNIMNIIDRKSNFINDEIIATAIEKKQFKMFYQPKIAIKTNKMIGLESLVRWERPNHGLIAPDFFIPKAEESGLIIPLTYWIIRNVFNQYAAWKKGKIILKLAINLPSGILTDLIFPNELIKLTNEFHVNPKHICFEITEAAAMNQADIILEVLTRIRLKGFSLAIDDFGTGYSSLVELQRMPFTELKIDKSFVSDVTTNKLNLNIVRSVINLAKNMNLLTVAEGVETQVVFNKLNEIGCDIAQGYLISQPKSVDDFNLWYRNKIGPDGIYLG